MYKLNNTKITKELAHDLVSDLALFPINDEDYSFSIDERKDKYLKLLQEEKKLRIADNKTLTVI